MNAHTMLVALAAALLVAPPSWSAARRHSAVVVHQYRVPHCKRGTLEPYVPNEEAAKSIFLAVEDAIWPHADKKRFPLVDAMGDGNQWRVFRHNNTEFDGGQLEMSISMCTGKITNVHLSG